MRVFISFITCFVFILQNITGQIDKFFFRPDKVKSGEVLFYKKSNQDGSNLHWVATYTANQHYMESLKWMDGDLGATLVSADMDWSTFSVRKFVGGNISPSGERIVGAQLDQLDEKGSYDIKIGDMQEIVQIDEFPWHSYDFDFASLNLVWPHLKEMKSGFTIHIADIIAVNGRPKFVNKGPVEIDYIKEEKRQGINCNQYKIDGPGLENRGGTIWLSKKDEYFIEYLIDLPDESSYFNMKFQFDRSERMTLEEWEQFKLQIAEGA